MSQTPLESAAAPRSTGAQVPDGIPADVLEEKARHAASFGPAATTYDRARPSYPIDAVRWLIPDSPGRALDLGAGTGKLTAVLAELVDSAALTSVVAVEPSAGMREQFGRVLPGLQILDGSAERIPLPAGSVDVVLVGQAWHWVDPAQAVPEVARVLRPGGLLGLLWNTRDETVDWVSDLTDIMANLGSGFSGGSGDPQVGPPFSPVERRDVAWTHQLTPDGLIDLVESRSYVLVQSDEQRAAIDRRVRELLATHPDLAGRAEIDLSYVTECWRYRLIG